MIPVIETPWEPEEWRLIMKHAFRSGHALLEALGTQLHGSDPQPDFPVLVPQTFAAKIQPGDPADPILRQVLAIHEERQNPVNFATDPLLETDSEAGFNTTPGLIHKYHGRVLLIATAGCAVHCRYCFRRHFPYADQRDAHFDQALQAVANDPSIEEVILSGGDPLLLGDQALQSLIERIAGIAHVQRLRIHSRIPVVLPQRITDSLLQVLSSSRLLVSLVVHTNHSQELDAVTARAFRCLRKADIWLFNQAVLLRGVNDSAGVQINLAKTLFAQQVLPYYLHVPDAVAGTHHFFLNRTECQAIYAGMQAQLPGYLLPKLVQEVPKKASKMIVSG